MQCIEPNMLYDISAIFIYSYKVGFIFIIFSHFPDEEFKAQKGTQITLSVYGSIEPRYIYLISHLQFYKGDLSFMKDF